MKKFSEFSKGEWFWLSPLRHSFKQFRNDTLLGLYLKRSPAALSTFLRENAHLRDANIVLTIAFGQPRVLDFLLAKASRFLPDVHFLVFDNSPDPSARIQIESVCRKHTAGYLGLPSNSIKHPNRSHGIAMTWIFRNVVRALNPRMFAFIDHDLIPFKTVDFSQTLGNRPFYGTVRAHKSAEAENIGDRCWSLWAGYCLYDFSAVKELPLNFLYDFSRGLDTGGRNWDCLYKNHDHPRPEFADSRKISLTDSRTGTVHKVRIVDRRWVHFRGTSYRREVQEQMDLYERLADALAENGAEITSF